MVFIAALVSAVLFSGFASGRPRPEPSLVTSSVSAPSVTDDASPIAVQTQSTDSYAPTTVLSAAGYGTGGSYASGSSSLQWSQTQSAASYAGATPSTAPSYGTGDIYDSSSSSWSTSSVVATSTASASGSYTTPAYGSGSSNWGGSGYDDCVAQCVASFGSPAASYAPTATVASASAGTGTGATITVIVAPTQGVLRYVPFAVNASVGDTIKFMWGANNHTVTKSSELAPCNKSADALFTSGTNNKDFVFTQVVNDTNPTFYYCGTPGHCQKGMFGIINPPNALGAPTSVSGMMSSLGANNSDVSAYASYTTKSTANNIKAANWGANIDMASLPDWSHSFVAENVLYTRNFLASNTEVLKDNGFVDLSAAGSTPLMIPQDISAALANASPSSVTSSTSAATTASVSSFASGTANSVSNGAGSLASPTALGGLVVVFVTLML